jgi:hypothetical protein
MKQEDFAVMANETTAKFNEIKEGHEFMVILVMDGKNAKSCVHGDLCAESLINGLSAYKDLIAHMVREYPDLALPILAKVMAETKAMRENKDATGINN